MSANAILMECPMIDANCAAVPAVKRRMLFLLQDCETSQFMRLDSTWSLRLDEALDFTSLKRAIFYGMKELLHTFQIVQIEALTGLAGGTVVSYVRMPDLQWAERGSV